VFTAIVVVSRVGDIDLDHGAVCNSVFRSQKWQDTGLIIRDNMSTNWHDNRMRDIAHHRDEQNNPTQR
jgi:hypothetical protein